MNRLPTSILRAAAVCALALGVAGCATTYNARALGVPVSMAGAAGEPVVGDSFAVTTKGVHLLWGLVAARQPSLQQVLAGQLGTGGEVRNLTIRSRKRLTDLLVTGLTLGVLSPTTVTFEGVVVQGTP